MSTRTFTKGRGGSSFGGVQTIEDNTAAGNFADTNTVYDPATGDIWTWVVAGGGGSGTLTKRYTLNSGGCYQPVAISYTGIIPPTGAIFASSCAPFIYNGNAYLYGQILGANLDILFRVIRLSDGTDLGETNIMVTIAVGGFSPTPSSMCCTNDGRIVFSTAFNNFLHAYEADITSTLVIGAATDYPITTSQAFTGAPKNWASYKKTKNNTNYFIQNKYFDYGTDTTLAPTFSVDSRVIFMGTTIDGQTIIGRQVTNTAGNPGTQPGQYLVISFWDTIGSDDGVTYNL